MLLHRHYRTVAMIANNQSLKYLLRDYFALPQRQALMPALLARGLGQADLVLALLRLRDRHHGVRLACESHIATLVGHPITVGPGCLVYYRVNGPAHVRQDTSPRITYVVPRNPRQPHTDAYLRWPEFRVGRSVAQLKMRGIKAKDLRVVQQQGWIRLEEVA